MIYIDDSEPEGELEPAFPYRDVTIRRNVDANKLYDILGEVGRGKFGTVYKCQEKGTGLKLAAKFVPIPKREDKRNVEREVEIMNSLQHHLIIQLYGAYEHQKMMCVVLELVEGGELFDRVVDDEFVLTERACVVFIRQVCEAMEFIHRNNILHLDLKPENILCLTESGNRIKIIDFGLARKYDPDKKLQVLFGTPEFVAPEVVNFDCIAYGTDMWSVGVICYVLISGLSPFMGETDIETMANVTIAKYDFEDESFSNVSSECIDFISKLLVKDLSTRMTAAQCLEHKWLQRRPQPPPIVTPKPLNVPPPKLKASTPSPIPPILDVNEVELPKVEVNANTTTATTDEGGKELDTTKDNLKNFIERWEEHPNSPYVFDVESNVIAPLSETPYKKKNDSISSSRVCSPSPCESIETLTDDDAFENPLKDDESPNAVATPVNESREKLFPSPTGEARTPSGSVTPTPQFANQQLFGRRFDELSGSGTNLNLQQRSIKSYLHTFDRRNSDTNYLLGRRASGERVNLAEEIRKLSDHLLMLAEINKKLGNEAKKDAVAISKLLSEGGGTQKEKVARFKSSKTKDTTTVNATSHSSTTSKVTNSTKKTSVTTHAIEEASTKTAKSAASTSTSTSASASASTSASVSSASSTASVSGTSPTPTPSHGHDTKSKYSNLSMRLQQSIEETPKLTNGERPTWAGHSALGKKSTVHTMATANARSTPAPAAGSSASATTEAAHMRRAKFRVNQMSRDVPIGLPNIHRNVNLEEAANTTKDCLLHLLEKYNETKTRNPVTRHQSISVDWNVSDNLEYRSMSSINAFFQRHGNTSERVKQMQAQLQEKVEKSTGGS